MNRTFILHLVSALSILLSISCSSTRNALSGDYSSLYRSDEVTFEPIYKLHHLGQNNYKLFFQFNSDELLYQKELNSNDKFSELSISATKFLGFGLGPKLDSVKTTVSDKMIGDRKRFISGILNVPFKLHRDNVLQTSSQDMVRQNKHVTYLSVDSTKTAAQNYMVRRFTDGFPILNEYVTNDATLELSSIFFQGNQLQVEYYNTDFGLALPPFSLSKPKKFDLEPLEKGTIQKNDKKRYTFEMKGFDLARVQDTIYGGDHSIVKFYSGFPKISTYGQMINAVKYITTKKEFSELSNSLDKKAALDEFWLERSGSEDRAKRILKTYYLRAEAANNYFTSHTEGWKADRGLIYIIFGRPISITKNASSEIWNYGEKGRFRSLRFTFVKIENPFTDNDYRLIRKEEYKPVWYYFVDAWRGGRVLN